MYSVFYSSAAGRQFRKLPSHIVTSIQSAIASLAETPRTHQTEKLEGSPNAYRLRVGRYRILYTIDDTIRRVVIYRIAHRRESYR